MLLLYLILSIGLVSCEDVVIKTEKGPVKGLRNDYEVGKYYYAFKGIRYAKAPVKELRFKAPVPPEPWTEPFEANQDGLFCPQFDIGQFAAIGDEDCLFLNVYSPKIDSKKRPVMVYIHGGAFMMGSGASYVHDPEYLVENDIVVVTFNYRLGALGFLAVDDHYTDANNGIKDMILALKWVKENIGKFGGDVGKVTLMGDDAGAAAASLLTLIPETKGLFHGVIALSGNTLCSQFIQNKPMQAALELASKFDCSKIDTGDDLLKCLSRQTQQEITEHTSKMFQFFSFPRWFVPVVDGILIKDTPEALLEKGEFTKVPFIIGNNKNDGAFYYRLTINSFNNGQYDDNFIDHKLPRLLPVISEYSSRVYPMSRAIRKKYFVNVDMENEDEFRPRFSEVLTDIMMTRCNDRFGKVLANHSVPTYSYLFDYRGQYSIANILGEQVDMGVVHGDEVQYIFPNVWGEDKKMSDADIRFSKNVFVPLLTNFVKTNMPTPEVTESITSLWEPLSPTSNKVYAIGDKLRTLVDYKKSILQFWYETIPAFFKKKSAKKDEL